MVEIARKQDLDASAPGTIARTGDYLYFEPGKPAYMLFDHDRKGMTDAVKMKLKEVGGFWNAMTQAIPGLAGAARVTRRSTSTGLYNAKTSESLSGSLNRHVYISAKDGSDIARALTTVQDRLWLAGYGYFVVGAAGQLLVRSIIDAAVYGPERLVFEGAPELVPPVAQDATKRQARAFRGTIIDTALAIPSLNEEESARLAELKAQAAQSLEGAVAAKRKVWAAAFAKKHGLSEKEVERIASQALKHVLEDNFELTFDDRRLGRRTVAEVVAEPDKYVGEALADPLEGVRYGRNKAKVYRQYNRELIIHSFAHGGINYRLAGQGTKLSDFQAHLPSHKYIYIPAREPWPAASVNAAVGLVTLRDGTGATLLDDKGNPKTVFANQWLDSNQCVEQMTWAPGLAVADRGSIDRRGRLDHAAGCHDAESVSASTRQARRSRQGGSVDRTRATDLSRRHRAHLRLAGPLRAASGCEDQSRADAGRWTRHRQGHAARAGQASGRAVELLRGDAAQGDELDYNPFARSVILRINEARDLGEFDRYKFYDHMKIYTAAPPDVLRVNDKYLPEYAIPNVCNVVITTNHRTDGLYLPDDDRRHYVAWSEARKEDFDQKYWSKLWRWYHSGGIEHVAAFLMQRDLTQFDPKAPPRKTEAFTNWSPPGGSPRKPRWRTHSTNWVTLPR